ncbi:MAG: DUF4276 family protein [Oscillospiraceae bacterium]|nr:DUF4276 family protein [Oscillospiraceae bacterium]
MKLVFLLEEPSMKYLLDELLHKLLPEDIVYQTIPHNGKSALRKSLPKKLRGWNEPGDVRFIVIHDQDRKDCIELKKQLVELCDNYNRKVLIRIVCQELEAWYFGDIEALAKAYGKDKINAISNKRQFQNPDSIPNPKEVLNKLLPEHQQIIGAKRVAPYMNVNKNTSPSFNCFVNGVKHFICK